MYPQDAALIVIQVYYTQLRKIKRGDDLESPNSRQILPQLTGVSHQVVENFVTHYENEWNTTKKQETKSESQTNLVILKERIPGFNMEMRCTV